MAAAVHDEVLTEPLLPGTDRHDDVPFTVFLRQECDWLLRRSAQYITFEILDFAAFVATTIQVGRFGTLHLSALGLAETLIGVTGLSIVSGLSSPLNTLCSQAFGAGQYGQLGVMLQRGVLIGLVACIPCVALWTQAEQIFLVTGQKAHISAMAAKYVHLCIPALFLFTIIHCCNNYFSAQNVLKPFFFTTVVETSLWIVMNYFFLYRWHWGIDGVAIAWIIAEVVGLMGITAIMIWNHQRQQPQERTWTGISVRGALTGWSSYFQWAIPALISSCLEGWLFQLLVPLVGLLPDSEAQLAAMSICWNISSAMWLVQGAIAGAADVRVAHYLGAGKGLHARMSAAISFVLVVGCTLVSNAVFWRYRAPFIALFTHDVAVRELVMNTMLWLLVSNLGIALSSVCLSVLSACNRPSIGMVINFLVYWCFCAPLVWYIGVKQQGGVPGVEMVVSAALVLQSLAVMILVVCLDWEHEVRRSRELMMEHYVPPSTSDEQTGEDSRGSPAREDDHDFAEEDLVARGRSWTGHMSRNGSGVGDSRGWVGTETAMIGDSEGAAEVPSVDTGVLGEEGSDVEGLRERGGDSEGSVVQARRESTEGREVSLIDAFLQDAWAALVTPSGAVSPPSDAEAGITGSNQEEAGGRV